MMHSLFPHPALLFLLLTMACSSPVTQETEPDFPEPTITVPDESTGSTVAFINVNVVPMDEPRVLENQTVLVQEGRIAEIGPVGEVVLSDSVEQIDGQGAYLMPGLSDMHVHFTTPDVLLLYLAYGVTTVRVMWGGAATLQRRADIAAGTALGPRIYSASPGLEGPTVYWPGTIQLHTAEEARSAVQQLVQDGYDFIKTYNSLTRPVYDAILDEAKAQGIPVVGHVPRSVSLTHALDAGHGSIAHLLGYASLVTRSGSWASGLDEARVATLVEATKAAGVWNGPTFTVLSPTHTQGQVASIKQSPAWGYLAESTKAWYDDARTQPPAQRDPRDEQNRKRFVKALHDVGARLLLTTDTGVQYVLPGVSVHEELQHLTDAGLTPYEALRTGTVAAAEFLGIEDEAGTLAVGNRADLVLLPGNPLDDLEQASRPLGVVVQGCWYSTKRLRDMLETLNDS